jgi:hypothetical protein
MGACVLRNFYFFLWVLSPGDSVSVFQFLLSLGNLNNGSLCISTSISTSA